MILLCQMMQRPLIAWSPSRKLNKDEKRRAPSSPTEVARHALVPVPWSAWFPSTPYVGDELFEFAVKLYPYDTVMSLLWLPTRY